jgi:tryptophan-rich sensory protein
VLEVTPLVYIVIEGRYNVKLEVSRTFVLICIIDSSPKLVIIYRFIYMRNDGVCVCVISTYDTASFSLLVPYVYLYCIASYIPNHAKYLNKKYL